MSLSLVAIGVIALAALLYAAFVPGRWRGWAVLLGSIVALFWLQGPLTPRYADFMLPGATVALAVAGWYFSRPPRRAFLAPAPGSATAAPPGELPASRVYVRDDWLTLLVVVSVVIALGLFRYVDAGLRLTPSRPPSPLFIAFTTIEVGLLFTALALFTRRLSPRAVLTGAIVAVVALFVAFKWPPATTIMAGWWRDWAAQDVSLAAPADLAWLGFSYVAFRIIHTLRDRQTGILPDLSLRAYLSYVLFAPAIVAGPIDRAERFADDYFDFGGYTDIAIGLGILFGIRLPENFDRPYTRCNITAFWQSWHITLSNWARFYIFTPLARALLRRDRRLSSTVIVLLSHLATMSVIGLWHGISPNFFIWGLWHAVALFAHKVWSDRTRKAYRDLQARPWPRRAWAAAGWVLTLAYVMLGWVWFLMPDVDGAVRVFGLLFGGQ